jgi:hypothetical protein
MLYNIELSKYIIGEDDFLRIQVDVTGHPIGWLEYVNYSDFLEWNNKCIYELSNEDDAWLVGLCGRMKNGRIMLQDMESCVQFQAYGFYFNQNKEIVIVNPR